MGSQCARLVGICSSVPSHLKDSQSGFDMRFWVHADKHLYLGISWRPKPARAVGFGPEYAAEACLARADRASVLGRSGDHGNHAPGRQEQADGVAMAAALPRGGRRWPVAGPAGGPGKPALGGEVISLVLTKTLGDKPPKATHWSLRTMAKAVGIGHSSVQRIWAKHGLKPHLVSTFKVSNDPKLAEKVADVVGLYLNPPDKALVYSMDEKARSRRSTAPNPGCRRTMTHDYKRNSRPMARSSASARNATGIRNSSVSCASSTGRRQNLWMHKHAKVKEWLAKHPRFHFHFTPTSASWLNQVERFFAEITRDAIRRRLQERPRTGGDHQRLPRQTQRYSQTLRPPPKTFSKRSIAHGRP